MTAVGSSPPSSHSFGLCAARSLLFNRLPLELRQRTVYKHFYTDDIGPSGDLSLRFFGLCISYFCSVCRLEGRRTHYLQSPSESAGQSFAKTHTRTRYLFQRLNATYGVILLTYNMHSELVYQKRRGGLIRKSGLDASMRYAAGAKPQGPAMCRERAFEYFADEMRFYEELYVFTEQILRIAFTDERLQTPIAEEINRIFRGSTFNFVHLRREQAVRQIVEKMDAEENGLLLNHRQMAEVLVAPPERLQLHEAQVSRTPFVACRFTPRPLSIKKYARPYVIPKLPPGLDDHASQRSMSVTSLESRSRDASLNSRASGSNPFSLARSTGGGYRVGTLVFAFPVEHRALRHFLKSLVAEQRSPRRKTVAITPNFRAFQPPPGLKPATAPEQEPNDSGPGGNAFTPLLHDFDAEINTMEEQAHQESYNSEGSPALQRDSGAAQSPSSDTVELTPRPKGDARRSVSALRTAVQYGKALRSLVDSVGAPIDDRQFRVAPLGTNDVEDWKLYDPVPEIDKVYQSLANGVVISTVRIPVDILATYSDRGFLLSSGD